MGAKESLVEAMKSGKTDDAVKFTKQALDEGFSAGDLVNTLTEGIREVGDAFEKFEIFLPEMMMASDAMIACMDILSPKLKEEAKGLASNPTKVVMATVKGDLHEIGKNIVITLLNANGYDVLDLGADVDSLDIIKTAQREKAAVIGLSSLMTTTMLGQKEVIDILNDMGLRDKVKVVIGGAPTNEEWAETIGADGWSKDAPSAVRLIDKLTK